MLIVGYHNVLAHRSNAFNMLYRRAWVLQKHFERQITTLAERFTIVPLQQIVEALHRGETIPNACALTFDDGYLGAYRYAAPVLERRGLPATFFVITQQVSADGQRTYDFSDKLEAAAYLSKADSIDPTPFGLRTYSLLCDACKIDFLRGFDRGVKTVAASQRAQLNEALFAGLGVPEAEIDRYLEHEAYQMVDWQQVDDLLGRGFTVGSHTRTHASLSRLDGAQLEAEVAGSLSDLQERTGQEALPFAYPFGEATDISEQAADAVRQAGYSCGLTMLRGANAPNADLYQLRRVTFSDLKKLELPVD